MLLSESLQSELSPLSCGVLSAITVHQKWLEKTTSYGYEPCRQFMPF
jgi:hypothetical protein